jgi:hypothetical protein
VAIFLTASYHTGSLLK